MKILVVDDSSVQRKFIISSIRQAGFKNEILEAPNGNLAIEQLGKNYKDIGLILCDWHMPELSGIEFLAAVGKIPQLLKIPLVMVTVETTESKIQAAKSAHPSLAGYLLKPFTPAQLTNVIGPILNR